MKKQITRIDIEDYYGNAIESIDFDNEIEIDLEEITIRVTNFSFADVYNDSGIVARVQCDVEGGLEDKEEVEQIHSELMEVLLENADGDLDNESEVSEKLMNALEMLIN